MNEVLNVVEKQVVIVWLELSAALAVGDVYSICMVSFTYSVQQMTFRDPLGFVIVLGFVFQSPIRYSHNGGLVSGHFLSPFNEAFTKAMKKTSGIFYTEESIDYSIPHTRIDDLTPFPPTIGSAQVRPLKEILPRNQAENRDHTQSQLIPHSRTPYNTNTLQPPLSPLINHLYCAPGPPPGPYPGGGPPP